MAHHIARYNQMCAAAMVMLPKFKGAPARVHTVEHVIIPSIHIRGGWIRPNAVGISGIGKFDHIAEAAMGAVDSHADPLNATLVSGLGPYRQWHSHGQNGRV